MVHLAQQIAAFMFLSWVVLQLVSICFTVLRALKTAIARKVLEWHAVSVRVSFALGYGLGRVVRRFI